MNRVNIQDAKTHFSKLVEQAVAGRSVVICLRNVPVAELRGLPKPPSARRAFGLHRTTVRRTPGSFGVD